MGSLEIDSVNFSYGQNKILSDIYLKVETGEVVGFLGRNGCGKSTLLKIIFGSIKGESQSVRINKKYYSRSLSTGLVKFSTQDSLFPNHLTPSKTASLFQSNLGRLKTHEEFEKHANYRFSELSTGMAKYLETLILLHTPCEFLLLDEPFSFIAPVHVEKLIPEIKLVSKEKGILVTDHQYESILTVSTRLYLMKDQSLYPIEGRQELEDFGYLS